MNHLTHRDVLHTVAKVGVVCLSNGASMDQMPTIYPVIHYQSTTQVMRNAEKAFEANCEGVFVISMEGDDHRCLHAASCLKHDFPGKKIGVNLLRATTMLSALSMSVKAGLDMTWTDEQLTHSSGASLEEAAETGSLYPDHLKFIGVAFKHQPREFHPELAARTAVELGFIPTTSGPATGVSADITHISGIRRAMLPNSPLAIASGITPVNVTGYSNYLTHILVSTGVSDSFYELSTDKLVALQKELHDQRSWPRHQNRW